MKGFDPAKLAGKTFYTQMSSHNTRSYPDEEDEEVLVSEQCPSYQFNEYDSETGELTVTHRYLQSKTISKD